MFLVSSVLQEGNQNYAEENPILKPGLKRVSICKLIETRNRPDGGKL